MSRVLRSKLLGLSFIFMCVFVMLCLTGFNNSYRIKTIPLESVVIITDGYGWGSGVIISDNLLLTAKHCLEHDNIYIIDIHNNKYDILDYWVDPNEDVGFAIIDCNLPSVKFGSMPNVLDTVYLVGAPYDKHLSSTITKGIVSFLGRDFWDWDNLIQTDANGASGSSGGPLLNDKFEIIGICVASPTPSNGGGVMLCEPISDILSALNRYELEVK